MSDKTEKNDVCSRSEILEVAEERLRVEKQVVETGRVTVATVVQEREETVEIPTVREEVVVERRPIDRFVDAAPQIRQEGDATIIPVVEEVIVIEKRLKLREELVVRRNRVESLERRTVRLRREEPTVKRVEAPRDESRGGESKLKYD